MGMSALTYYTAEMVRALPEDGNKYETVYGELLVNPSPRPWHEIVVKRLVIALDTYLIRNVSARCFALVETFPGVATRWFSLMSMWCQLAKCAHSTGQNFRTCF